MRLHLLGWIAAPIAVAMPSSALADADETSDPPPSGALETKHAEEQAPKDWDVELGGTASYMTGPIRGGTSPFGAGFGARLGVSIAGIYFGLSAIDYLGGSDVSLSDHALLYGVEAGYGLRTHPFGGPLFTLRPTVGVGDAAVSHTDPSLSKVDVVTTASGSSSSRTSDTITVNNVYVRPGITAMLSSSMNFVAIRGDVLIIPGISYGGSSEPTTWLSYGIQGELGFRF